MAIVRVMRFAISWSVRQRFPKIETALQELLAGPQTVNFDPDTGREWFQLPDPYGGLHFSPGRNVITKARATLVMQAWRHFRQQER